jgi:DNA-binding response OmpR family regulator
VSASRTAVDAQDTPPRRPAPEAAPRPAAVRPRVVLAEDDPDVQALVRHVLHAEGYEVDVCGDGETTLQRCLEEPPDLLVLDVMMPRLTGFEVLSRLRAGGAAELPVLVLSARGSETDIVTGFDLGVADYMTKPFMLGELRARVRSLLARRAAAR